MRILKYVMVMVAAVAGVISAAAGTPRKVDVDMPSTVGVDSIIMSTVRGSRSKTFYKYDDKDRVILKETYDLKNSVWEKREISSWSYDDKDREVFKETFICNERGSWGTRLASEYDDEARTTIVTEQSKEGDGDWTLVEVTEKVFDSQNRLQITTVSNPDKGWSYLYLYEYTDNGEYKNINVNWRVKPENKYQPWRKYEWTRNGNAGTMIVSGLIDGKWRNDIKFDFKLNAYGDTAQTTTYNWNYEINDSLSGEWSGYEKNVYKYDEQRRLIELRWYMTGKQLWREISREKIIYGQFGIEEWRTYTFDNMKKIRLSFSEEYYCNDSRQLDLIKFYVINQDTGNLDLDGEWRYYYSQSGLAMPTVGTVRLSGLTLELGEEQPVKVYTVGGCLVYSGRAASVQLPAQGLYLVRTPASCAKVLAR